MAEWRSVFTQHSVLKKGTPSRDEVPFLLLFGLWTLVFAIGRLRRHAANFTGVVLMVANPGPPIPKLTLNCAVLPRAVLRMPTI